MSCVFCRIVAREIPADVVFENDSVIAFKDINPAAPVHVLVVPKEHLDSLDELPGAGGNLASQLLAAVVSVAEKLGVAGGYKLINNCGEAAGQVVPHLHFHILAGRKFVP
jgi:histidine triad (HIT) family protein